LQQEETTVKRIIALVLLAVAIGCPSIMADQLSLKNGD
jgi:hypothetical protein